MTKQEREITELLLDDIISYYKEKCPDLDMQVRFSYNLGDELFLKTGKEVSYRLESLFAKNIIREGQMKGYDIRFEKSMFTNYYTGSLVSEIYIAVQSFKWEEWQK